MKPETEWPAAAVEMIDVDKLIPYARNARTHSETQVAQLAASMMEWGWTVPILVDEDGMIIAGHGRIMAAKKLGLAQVPSMTARGWTKAQKQAYVLADNRLAENAGWDDDKLKVEFAELRAAAFDVHLIGFSVDQMAKLEDADFSDLRVGSDQSRSGADLEYLSIDGHKVPMNEDERDALHALLTDYENANGSTAGFAAWLCEGL